MSIQTILYKAVEKNDKDVTVQDVETWTKGKKIQELADFIYKRHYSRYLKIFDYDHDCFKK